MGRRERVIFSTRRGFLATGWYSGWWSRPHPLRRPVPAPCRATPPHPSPNFRRPRHRRTWSCKKRPIVQIDNSLRCDIIMACDIHKTILPRLPALPAPGRCRSADFLLPAAIPLFPKLEWWTFNGLILISFPSPARARPAAEQPRAPRTAKKRPRTATIAAVFSLLVLAAAQDFCRSRAVTR